MADNLRNGTCLCGLKLALHFDHNNRKLTCAEAAELAGKPAKAAGFRAALVASIRKSLRVVR